MTAAQPDLFGKPRRPRRVLMHMVDAGYSDGRAGFVGDCIQFKCPKCGHDTGWVPMRTVSGEKRGRPCPRCNDQGEH